jgi:hypothetical protein
MTTFPLHLAVFFRIGILLLTFSANMRAATPDSWTGVDVGASSPPPALAGSRTYDPVTGRITLLSSGAGIGGQADTFFFLHTTLAGDGEIVARVSNQTNTNNWARAGIMLRTSLAPEAPQISVFVTPGNGIQFQCRPTSGASAIGTGIGKPAGPLWLKIVRVGDRFSAFRSSDRAHWSQVGATFTLPLPATLLAGLAQDSVKTTVRGSADYDDIALNRTAGGTLPAGVEAAVIGRPESLGSATVHPSGDAFTLQTTAQSLGSAIDDFLFLQKPMTGDGDLVARLTDLHFTNGWARAGIAIRSSLARDASGLGIYITAANGITVEYRAADGGSNTQRVRTLDTLAPRYLKLSRRGVILSAFQSADGVAWSPLGEPVPFLDPAPAHAGLALSASDKNAEPIATARFDHVAWPTPTVLPPAETDPVVLAGLAAWRKPDGNGVSCVDCHTPFGYDVAQFSFNRDDVRLATTPHLSQEDADAIFDMLEVYRDRYPPVGGLKNFRTFRPLQPGGGVVLGGEDASADARDLAFGRYLKTHYRLAQDRITTLAEARTAGRELIDTDVASVPIGVKFNLWSRSVLREGAVAGGEIAEWLPSAGLVPKPGFADAWFALHDAYIRDPSTDNMWAIYEASTKWVDFDPHNFEPGVVDGRWGHIVGGQYRANLLFTHDELLKARGQPSLLAALDGVRPFPEVRRILTAELTPFWTVADQARTLTFQGFNVMPRRNRETVHIKPSTQSLTTITGGQIQDFRLTWFWIGWMHDNSLRFSGSSNSTRSGEYFIGSLWGSESEEPSSDGYRFHQVFFNAVHQFKLGFKPGAYGDDPSAVQSFQASRNYYLSYNRWKPLREPTEPGLEESGPLYRRILSNHIRAALLVHADEARARDGQYSNKENTIRDINLWRQVLAWADPEWAQADEALFAELRASLTATLTPEDLSDQDGDGRPALLASALGMPTPAEIAADENTGATTLPGSVFAERYGTTPEGRLTLAFFRARADLTYVVEASEDLATWRVLVTNPGVVGEEVTVADTASTPDAPRRFLRLRIIKALP